MLWDWVIKVKKLRRKQLTDRQQYGDYQRERRVRGGRREERGINGDERRLDLG